MSEVKDLIAIILAFKMTYQQFLYCSIFFSFLSDQSGQAANKNVNQTHKTIWGET